MKLLYNTVFSIILILVILNPALGQRYRGGILLQYGPIYVYVKDSIAYYDYWGGKKTVTYYFKDTLLRKTDKLYANDSISLTKETGYWQLSGLKHRTLRLHEADSVEFRNWLTLINWLSFLEVQNVLTDCGKISISELPKETQKDWRELLGDHNLLTIDEYARRIDEFCQKYALNVAHWPPR
jgi:hypothetical protein